MVMGLALVLTLSRSGIICFGLAIAATGWFVIRARATRGRRIATAFLTVLFVGVIGWVGVDAIADSLASAEWRALVGRRDAWLDAIHVAARFPLAGTGLNTYGVATLFYQTAHLEEHFAQAHNDYLQVAAEGGLLLAVPVFAALGLLIREIRRRFAEQRDDTVTYWLRAGAVTGLIGIGLQEMVDFSLQMPGNAALFSVLAAIAVHRPEAVDLRHAKTRL